MRLLSLRLRIHLVFPCRYYKRFMIFLMLLPGIEKNDLFYDQLLAIQESFRKGYIGTVKSELKVKVGPENTARSSTHAGRYDRSCLEAWATILIAIKSVFISVTDQIADHIAKRCHKTWLTMETWRRINECKDPRPLLMPASRLQLFTVRIGIPPLHWSEFFILFIY